MSVSDKVGTPLPGDRGGLRTAISQDAIQFPNDFADYNDFAASLTPVSLG
jgi:hypothetical protein